MKVLHAVLIAGTLWLMAASVHAQSVKAPFDTTHYGRNAQVGSYVNTRGFKMYYETYGKGEPLLIIHGNGGP